MGKNFADLTPPELNALLIEKCGINLHFYSAFAFEVARWKTISPAAKNPNINNPLMVELYKQIGKKGDEPEFCPRVSITEQTDRSLLIGLKKKIGNLQNKIINTVLETETLLYFVHRNKDELKNKENILRFMRENGLLKFYYDLLRYKSDIDKALDKCKKGAPINRRNMLCSVWANYLIELNKGINWNLLADLMDWYWAKFSHYEIYKDFRPTKEKEQSDPEYLKNQFYKQKKRWGLYYKSIRPRVVEAEKEIIVFGQWPHELESTTNIGMELSLRYIKDPEVELPSGKLWGLAKDIYTARAKYERQINIKCYNDLTRDIKAAKESGLPPFLNIKEFWLDG